jgi:rare lipoprotein A
LAGDGPGNDIPPNLENTPDAVPVNEPLHRYANRPYVALGNNYTPLTETGKYKARGIASWYGKKFHGQNTSSGEPYDMYKMTAAHPTLPVPSYARVTNVGNGRSVVVRINDRGPFLHDRLIDLSYAAATKLAIIGNGSAQVEVESLTADSDPTPAVHASGRTYALQNEGAVSSTPLPTPEPSAAIAEALPVVSGEGGDHFLQLGAFRSQESAESFRAKMQSELSAGTRKLSLYPKNDGLVRVHLGPYPNDTAARAAAEKLEAQLGFKPMVSKH